MSDFEADYTLGVQTACDMCQGSGKMRMWSTKKDGGPVMGSTRAMTDEEYKQEERWLKKNAKVVAVPCDTCHGSGIMPEYLKPGYWAGRMVRLPVEAGPVERLRRWLFG